MRLRRAGPRGDERGQGLAEFAIVVPVFLLVVFGMIDIGRVIWATDNITNAAREGARYASIHGDSSVLSSFCPTGPGLAGTPAPSCPGWSPDSKQPTREATKGFLVAAGTGTTVGVCYYTTTACSGDTDQTGATNTRGNYVTVTVQSTVPIITGNFIGLSGLTINSHSTVIVNN